MTAPWTGPVMQAGRATTRREAIRWLMEAVSLHLPHADATRLLREWDERHEAEVTVIGGGAA